MAPVIRFANPLVVAQDHMHGIVNLLSRTHLGSSAVVAVAASFLAVEAAAASFRAAVASFPAVEAVVASFPAAAEAAALFPEEVVVQAVLRSPLLVIQAGEVIPAIGI